MWTASAISPGSGDALTGRPRDRIDVARPQRRSPRNVDQPERSGGTGESAIHPWSRSSVSRPPGRALGTFANNCSKRGLSVAERLMSTNGDSGILGR
jgi:hypothetical protein